MAAKYPCVTPEIAAEPKMRVKLINCVAGLKYVLRPDAIVDFPKSVAERLIDAGEAEAYGDDYLLRKG